VAAVVRTDYGFNAPGSAFHQVSSEPHITVAYDQRPIWPALLDILLSTFDDPRPPPHLQVFVWIRRAAFSKAALQIRKFPTCDHSFPRMLHPHDLRGDADARLFQLKNLRSNVTRIPSTRSRIRWRTFTTGSDLRTSILPNAIWQSGFISV
jgi:hypothetical protein